MSIQAVGWAINQKIGDATAKLILIALADFADEIGQCWPAQATLAERAECSIDTVQRKLKRLKSLVSVTQRNTAGGRSSNVYMLHISGCAQAETSTARTPNRKLRLGAQTANEPTAQTAKPPEPKPQSFAVPKPQHSAVTGTVIEPSEPSISPLPPKGGVTNWKTAFADPDLKCGVERAVDGSIHLVSGTRQFWLDQFGGDEARLDLALIETSGRVQPNSATSIKLQVERALARIAGEKHDKDQRYAAAVKAKPAPAAAGASPPQTARAARSAEFRALLNLPKTVEATQ